MKISNELKVGVLSILTIGLLFYGYNYLRGKDVFSKSLTVKAKFPDVAGLQISAPIKSKGVQVGTVQGINFEQLEGVYTGNVIVTFNLHKDTRIPKTAIPRVYQASLMSGMEINLEYYNTCSGDDCLQNGDLMIGSYGGSFLGEALKQVDPILTRVTSLFNVTVAKMDSLFAGTLKEQSPNGLGNSIADIKATLSNLKQLSASVSSLVSNNSQSLTNTISNIKSITGNIEKNNGQISTAIANFTEVSNRLKTETMSDVHGTIGNVNTAINDLKNAIAAVNAAVTNINNLVQNIQTGEGVVPKLLNDKELAIKVENTIKQVELLSQDLRLNPGRYTTILKKRRPAYKKPKTDPGLDTTSVKN